MSDILDFDPHMADEYQDKQDDLVEFLMELFDSQKDMELKYQKFVNDHFWELV